MEKPDARNKKNKFEFGYVIMVDAECDLCGKAKLSGLCIIKEVRTLASGRTTISAALVYTPDDTVRSPRTWCACKMCATVISIFGADDLLFIYGKDWAKVLYYGTN